MILINLNLTRQLGKYLLPILFLMCYLCSSSQSNYLEFSSGSTNSPKPSLKLEDLDSWPITEDALINSSGDFLFYSVKELPVKGYRSLIVKSSLNESWEKVFVYKKSEQFDAVFNKSGNRFIISKRDSIFILQIGTDKIDTIVKVSKCRFSSQKNPEYLSYQQRNRPKELMILNLQTSKEIKFENINDWKFNRLEKDVLLFSMDSVLEIKLFNFEAKIIRNILREKKAQFKNSTFDDIGQQIAFTILNNSNVNILYYYDVRNSRLVKKWDDELLGSSTIKIDGVPKFSKNGKWIFIDLKETISDTSKYNVNVEIWSYSDKIIYPSQANNLKKNEKTIKSFIKANANDPLIRLPDDFVMLKNPETITGDLIVVKNFENTPFWWTLSQTPNRISIFDLESRKYLIDLPKSSTCFTFSPSGKVLLYYDAIQKGFYSFNTSNSTISNITNPRSHSITPYVNEYAGAILSAIYGWVDDSHFLISDSNDIFKIDALGIDPVIKLTGNWGKVNSICFVPLFPDQLLLSDTIFLSAFNRLNKENGIFYCLKTKPNSIKKMCMGPYTIYKTIDQGFGGHSFNRPFLPQKSNKTWLIQKQSVTEALNFYVTDDFSRIRKVSNISPQIKYNWIKAELLNYKTLSGKKGQAILYKPENFDSTKRYPVIFNYYEQLTHRLFEYPYPELMAANIDIAWFVSNGYLVCTPDILFEDASKTGLVLGDYAYDYIQGTYDYLKQFSFVNSKKIGLQGHSFGGLQTAIFITKSTQFAAAIEASGSTDPISAYLTLVPFSRSTEESYSKQELIELGHESYGCTPWDNFKLYQRNSAVINANKIETPVLIMHNKKDGQINFRQGVELYMALRRLHKKCWLLQYDDGAHTLSMERDKIDFTTRTTQFFNHLLMDSSPPEWMNGAPASSKGKRHLLSLMKP